MPKDIHGREFSWQDVNIVWKADHCFFRLLGDKDILEVPYTETDFSDIDEAERELEKLRIEEKENM